MANERDSDLIGLYKAIDRMNTKWRVTEQPKVNDKSTILGMWNMIRHMHYFLQNEYREMQNKYREKAVKWNDSYRAKQERMLQNEFKRCADNVNESIKQDIGEFVIRKTELVDKMISTAPSESDLRLLQALQMRGTNIKRAELLRILPSLYGNYNAMRILQTIGNSIGCVVHLPQGSDAIEILNTLDAAGAYFTRMADEAVNPGKPSMAARPFFYIDKEDGKLNECADGAVKQFSAVLDYVPQLSDFSIDFISQTDRARLQVMFREADKLDEDNAADQVKIAEITRQILQDHPEDVDLILRSEYGRYARTLVDLHKKEMDEKHVKVSNQEHAEDIRERVTGEV